MRRRFFLLSNPGAGVSRSTLADEVVRLLGRAGAEVVREQHGDIAFARRAAHAATECGRYDAIVAAGGDGTIRQVGSALLGTDTPLGIIPAGTGNVLAHEIGLERSAEAIAHTLMRGPAVRVASARANGEHFLLMAGAGFDARVVSALDHGFKSRIGKAAYAGPLVGALVRPMDRLSVSVDGRRHEASWVVVANARHYGGRFVMAPGTGIHERGLQAILFKARSRAVLVSQIMSLVLGRLDARAAGVGDVQMLACSQVRIAAQNPVPAQLDGDCFGTTPLEIEAGTAELQLIVPAAAPGRSNSQR